MVSRTMMVQSFALTFSGGNRRRRAFPKRRA